MGLTQEAVELKPFRDAQVVVSNVNLTVDYDLMGTPTGMADQIRGKRISVVEGETVVWHKDVYPVVTINPLTILNIPSISHPVREKLAVWRADRIANRVNAGKIPVIETPAR